MLTILLFFLATEAAEDSKRLYVLAAMKKLLVLRRVRLTRLTLIIGPGDGSKQVISHLISSQSGQPFANQKLRKITCRERLGIYPATVMVPLLERTFEVRTPEQTQQWGHVNAVTSRS
jgi:hypothetical protein